MSYSLIITFVCFLCMYSGSKCEIYKQTWWSYITFSLCRIWHYLVPIFSWTWSPSASKSCHSHYLYIKFLVNGFQTPSYHLHGPLGFIIIFSKRSHTHWHMHKYRNTCICVYIWIQTTGCLYSCCLKLAAWISSWSAYSSYTFFIFIMVGYTNSLAVLACSSI